MKPIRTDATDAVLGVGQGFEALPVERAVIPAVLADGSEAAMHVLRTRWEFSREDMQRLGEGGVMVMELSCTAHPACRLYVE